MNLNIRPTADPDLDAALTRIEQDLKKAVMHAITEVNVLLATEPADTEVLHEELGDLHRLATNLDKNRAERGKPNFRHR